MEETQVQLLPVDQDELMGDNHKRDVIIDPVCKACKYWKPFLFTYAKFEQGSCLFIKPFDGNSDIIAYIDADFSNIEGSKLDAWLNTLANFGCNQWEQKE